MGIRSTSGTVRTGSPLANNRVAWAVEIILFAAAYYLSGRLGLLLAIPPGYATAIWPPAGIALAVTLLRGYRVLPGVWLGSCAEI